MEGKMRSVLVFGVVILLVGSVFGVALASEYEVETENQETLTDQGVAEENPTEIHDWYDLNDVRDDLNGDYVLMNNLDEDTEGYNELAGTDANDGRGWEPIGEWWNPFNGSFDGNGYRIEELYIERPEETSVGLFAQVGWDDFNATVKNLNLVDIEVTGSSNVGGLVGGNYGIIEKSFASGTVSGNHTVGGLVGQAWLDTRVRNSYFVGNVTGELKSEMGIVGGLVGSARGEVINARAEGMVAGSKIVGGLLGIGHASNSSASVDVMGEENITGGLVGSGGAINSYSVGNVEGKERVGGLVGENSGTVENSYAEGDVSGEGFVGGLVGLNVDSGENSYATGDVNGEEDVGGLVGLNYEVTGSNSYATGDVSGDWGVGGLVGTNSGTVENSYATGNVSGDSSVGGLVGLNEEGTVDNSYWNIETSRQNESDGGEGRTTEEMTWEYDEDTYEGWDFEDIWLDGNHEFVEDHEENAGYPALRWQEEEVELTINIDGEATVEVDGEEVEDGWTGTYEDGTDVNLKAIPEEGWYFVEWTGNYEGTEEEMTITMDEDKEITAHFEEDEDTPGFTSMILVLGIIIAVAIYQKKKQ